MVNIYEILQRAASLKEETVLNSISPERAGGIMYDTLLALNDLWLQQGSALVISKIYASVAAMEADTAPVSDLTGKPLRPGQIVVIASSDSDNGSVYRYNGTDAPSWSLVGAIGNLTPVDSLDSDSTMLPLAAHQGKVLDGKISQLGQGAYEKSVYKDGETLNLIQGTGDYTILTFNAIKQNLIYYVTAKCDNFTGYAITINQKRLDNTTISGVDKQVIINGDVIELPINQEAAKIEINVSSALKAQITQDTLFEINIIGKTYYSKRVLDAIYDLEKNDALTVQLKDSVYDEKSNYEFKSGHYFNTYGINIGDIFNTSNEDSNANANDLVINVKTIDYVRLKTKGSGTSTIKSYVLTDSSDIVKEVGDSNSVDAIIDTRESSFLYINAWIPSLSSNEPIVVTYNNIAKEVREQVLPTCKINWLDGKYISTNGKNIGDISNGIASNNNSKLGIVYLSEGITRLYLKDLFSQTQGIRAYSIVDVNNKILEFAEIANTVTKTITEFPAGSYKIYINNWNKNYEHQELEPSFGDAYYDTDRVLSNSLELQQLKLSNKKIIFFGDSLTEGEGSVNIKYPDYVGQLLGCNITNLGVGGSHLTPNSLSVQNSQNGLYVYNLISAWCSRDFSLVDASIDWAHNSEYGTRWDHVQSTLKSTTPEDYDIVCIAAGTNDWNNSGNILGQWGDTDPVHNQTVTIKEIVRMLCEANPNLHIVILSPIVRYMKDDDGLASIKPALFSDSYLNPNSELYLYDFAEKQVEVAKKCHVDYIDNYWSLFNMYNWLNFTFDGTHCNSLGYKAMGERVARHLIGSFGR